MLGLFSERKRLCESAFCARARIRIALCTRRGHAHRCVHTHAGAFFLTRHGAETQSVPPCLYYQRETIQRNSARKWNCAKEVCVCASLQSPCFLFYCVLNRMRMRPHAFPWTHNTHRERKSALKKGKFSAALRASRCNASTARDT